MAKVAEHVVNARLPTDRIGILVTDLDPHDSRLDAYRNRFNVL